MTSGSKDWDGVKATTMNIYNIHIYTPISMAFMFALHIFSPTIRAIMICTLLLLVGVVSAQLPPGFPGPPPPTYMVDNQGNTFGVAPDKANFTGSVTSHHNGSFGMGSVNGSDYQTISANLTSRHVHDYSHSHSHLHRHAHANAHGNLHTRMHSHSHKKTENEGHQRMTRSSSGYWLEWLAGQGLVRKPY